MVEAKVWVDLPFIRKPVKKHRGSNNSNQELKVYQDKGKRQGGEGLCSLYPINSYETIAELLTSGHPLQPSDLQTTSEQHAGMKWMTLHSKNHLCNQVTHIPGNFIEPCDQKIFQEVRSSHTEARNFLTFPPKPGPDPSNQLVVFHADMVYQTRDTDHQQQDARHRARGQPLGINHFQGGDIRRSGHLYQHLRCKHPHLGSRTVLDIQSSTSERGQPWGGQC